MTGDVLTFLRGEPGYIALFEAVEAAVGELGESQMAVSKTQISWGNPLKFAFLSFPLRRGRDWPPGSMVLTFGLGQRLEHPRIVATSNPYPDRWTHHTVLTVPGDVDGAVGDFLRASYAFARRKRRKGR